MRIQEIIAYLEKIAPLGLQESYDNSGLLVGSREMEVKKVLVSLDCTEAIVEEAIQVGAQMIISHHPIIFNGLSSLTGATYVERTVIKAIQNNIAIYAIHTNLDNVSHGVNKMIAEKLGIKNCSILRPIAGELEKLVVYTPLDAYEKVSEAMFAAGGGNIGNYSECGFRSKGLGTFKPNEHANPQTGETGMRHEGEEFRLEVLVEKSNSSSVIAAMKEAHPYEEVPYELISLENLNFNIGAGMIGELEKEMKTEDFLDLAKKQFSANMLRHSKILKKNIKKIAFCGGAGSFLIGDAIRQKADLYLSADMKYHEFFDGEEGILLADIGHYEIEQYTIELIYDVLTENFNTFAVQKSRLNTNPITYR